MVDFSKILSVRTSTCPVPSWGGEVELRGANANFVLRWLRQSVDEKDGDQFEVNVVAAADLLSRCIVAGDTLPMNSDEGRERLIALFYSHADSFAALLDHARYVCELTDDKPGEEQPDAEKKKTKGKKSKRTQNGRLKLRTG